MKLSSRLVRQSIVVSCENIDCDKPQLFSFTPSEFDEWIEDEEFECETCKKELSADGVTLRCYICDAKIEFDYLSQIPVSLDERCPYCAGHPTWDADFYSVVIDHSWAAERGIYDWMAKERRTRELERSGRTDYWEGLVHFCQANEFISIYKERRIRASPTGLYGKRNPSQTKAVCLTEATAPNWDELKAAHDFLWKAAQEETVTNRLYF